MMKYCLAASAVVALVGAPALATGYLDGTVNTWATQGLLHTENMQTQFGTVGNQTALKMIGYGVTVQNGTFYAVVQFDNPISTIIPTGGTLTPDGPITGHDTAICGAWAGWYINASNSASPQLANQPWDWGIPSSANPTGVDIEPEWDINTPAMGLAGLNLWGANGDAGQSFGGVNNSALAAPYYAQHSPLTPTSTVLAFSMPVAGIQAALDATGQGVTAVSSNLWKVWIKLESSQYDPNGTNGWTDDGGYTNDTVTSLTVPFTPELPYLPGDADRSGTVNGSDLNTVLSNFNKTVSAGDDGWALGDFDGNGTINGADLNTVLSNFNQVQNASAAVPEPSALLLAAAGLAGLLAYAWRKRRK